MRLSRLLFLVVLAASLAPAALVLWAASRTGAPMDGPAVGAAAAALVAALAASAVVARRVTGPIGELVREALEIARGRFGRQVPHRSRDELGDLAYTFNHMSRELAAYDGENRRLIAALEQGYLDTIRSLAGAIDAKDPYTRGHAERVAALSVEIGRELSLTEGELRSLEYAGVLHDIGKIGVPEQVLAKAEPLTEEELQRVRVHPVVGAEIVRGVSFLAAAEPAIRHHHERWDGGGYPDGLAGETIPLLARVVNAADTWDACSTERPYQRAMAPGEVVAILAGLRGRQLDPAVHDALLRVLARRGLTTPREVTA